MNIIFDKAFGRLILVAIFRKQSGHCYFCNRKVTERNLGMVFKNKDNEAKVCCNSIFCAIQYVDMTRGAK